VVATADIMQGFGFIRESSASLVEPYGWWGRVQQAAEWCEVLSAIWSVSNVLAAQTRRKRPTGMSVSHPLRTLSRVEVTAGDDRHCGWRRFARDVSDWRAQTVPAYACSY
jgi:hypothetical protein